MNRNDGKLVRAMGAAVSLRSIIWISVAAIFLISLLAGCYANAESSRIVGTWQIAYVDELAERVAGDVESDEDQPAMMRVRFERSGKLATETAIGSINSTKTGTWKFVSYEQSTGLMHIECSLQGQITKHEIEFQSKDAISWIPPNMAGTANRIQFQRK